MGYSFRVWSLALLITSYFYCLPLGRFNLLGFDSDFRIFDFVILLFWLLNRDYLFNHLSRFFQDKRFNLYYLKWILIIIGLSVVFHLAYRGTEYLGPMAIRLFRFFAYFLTLPAFIAIVRNERDLKLMTWVFYGNILIQAMLAFLQGIDYLPHFWPDYWREMYSYSISPVGTLSPHHKHMSLVMLIGFVLTLGFIDISRSLMNKVFFGTIGVIMLSIPLFAGTRTYLLAFAGFFLGLLFITKIRLIPLALILGIGYGLFTLNLSKEAEQLAYDRINYQYQERIVEELEKGGVEQMALARTLVYKSIYKAIVERPYLLITGTGFQAISVFIRGTGAHNNFLQFLMETGLIGFVIFILFLLKTSSNLYKAKKSLKNRWGTMSGYIWAGFIGLVFSMMVGETLYTQPAMFTLAGQIMIFLGIGITPFFWSEIYKRKNVEENHLER